MSIIVPLAIIGILIGINGLYVAAEFAAVSARRSRVAQVAEDGNALARRLLPILDDGKLLDRYVACCQIGITLSSLMLGAFGQATLAGQFSTLVIDAGIAGEVAAQGAAAVVVLVGLTVLQVLFGELVPKTLALQYPTNVALYTVIPMRWSLKLLRPFIALLNGSGLLILRLLRAPETRHRHIHSTEEIALLIVDSRDGGLLQADEHQRLRRALTLSALPARSLMVPRRKVVAIEAGTPLDEVIDTVISSPFTRFPVYKESIDNVIGVLHTKDLVRRYTAGERPPLELVIRPAVSVPETARADALIATFREQRAQQAIVIDEYGGVAGVLSLEDVISGIVGSVPDEFKGGAPKAERTSETTMRLPGVMRLDEAAELLGTQLDGEADTVGGYIAEVLGRLPDEGDEIQVDGVQIRVERVANHAVVSVLTTQEPVEQVEA